MNAAALLTKLLKRDTLHLDLAPASRQPARAAGSSAARAEPSRAPCLRPAGGAFLRAFPAAEELCPCQPGLGKPLIHYLPLL